MKENILIVLAILILAALLGQNCCKFAKNNRYEVVSGPNMLTILVDKQTGETWRNCICGKDSNVPGCWEKMFTINPESFNKPIGEAKAVDKMIKLQKEVLKEQEKQAKKQQLQQPVQQPQK